MEPTTYDPAIQTSRDGPLTAEFKQSILEAKARNALSFGDIATQAQIAASTLANITRENRNTSTATANRLKGVIEQLYFEEGFRGEPRKPGLTIAEAKKGLALTFGVTPEAIEITIRG